MGADNDALRLRPLAVPGWGREGIAYGPLERRPGRVLVVNVLNGHNASQTFELPSNLRDRLRRALRDAARLRFRRRRHHENMAVGWFATSAPTRPEPRQRPGRALRERRQRRALGDGLGTPAEGRRRRAEPRDRLRGGAARAGGRVLRRLGARCARPGRLPGVPTPGHRHDGRDRRAPPGPAPADPRGGGLPRRHARELGVRRGRGGARPVVRHGDDRRPLRRQRRPRGVGGRARGQLGGRGSGAGAARAALRPHRHPGGGLDRGALAGRPPARRAARRTPRGARRGAVARGAGRRVALPPRARPGHDWSDGAATAAGSWSPPTPRCARRPARDTCCRSPTTGGRSACIWMGGCSSAVGSTTSAMPRAPESASPSPARKPASPTSRRILVRSRCRSRSTSRRRGIRRPAGWSSTSASASRERRPRWTSTASPPPRAPGRGRGPRGPASSRWVRPAPASVPTSRTPTRGGRSTPCRGTTRTTQTCAWT